MSIIKDKKGTAKMPVIIQLIFKKTIIVNLIEPLGERAYIF
jgi:hypothetical protein